MKDIKTRLIRRFEDTDFSPGDAVLDLTTAGRYWRTSRLLRIDLIVYGDAHEAVMQSLIAERESDEYDMLTALPDLLAGTGRIITFNGHSFDLPHLRKKYMAYGLAEPLGGKTFIDLFLLLKDLAAFFGLPSRRLADYKDFLMPGVRCSDAEATMELLSMLRYGEFMSGACTIDAITCDGERMVCDLKSDHRFPRDVSVHDTPFHIVFHENGTVRLSSRLTDGRLRYYHTDVEQYEYLPEEGYAVHKSAAQFVDPSRKEKAVRENCFHLVSAPEQLLSDRAKAEAYLNSVLDYLKSNKAGRRASTPPSPDS